MMLVPRLFWLFPPPKQTLALFIKRLRTTIKLFGLHCYICEDFIVGLSPPVDLTFTEPLLIQSPIQLY